MPAPPPLPQAVTACRRTVRAPGLRATGAARTSLRALGPPAALPPAADERDGGTGTAGPAACQLRLRRNRRPGLILGAARWRRAPPAGLPAAPGSPTITADERDGGLGTPGPAAPPSSASGAVAGRTSSSLRPAVAAAPACWGCLSRLAPRHHGAVGNPAGLGPPPSLARAGSPRGYAVLQYLRHYGRQSAARRRAVRAGRCTDRETCVSCARRGPPRVTWAHS